MKGEIIDGNGRMVARVDVELKGDHYEGSIVDLTPNEEIRELFQTLEDVVDGQVFSLLDAVEERIAALDAVFATSSKSTAISDVQIFPTEMVVSFRAKQP